MPGICSPIVPAAVCLGATGGALCSFVPFYWVIVRGYLFVSVLLLDLIGESARE